MGLVTVGGTQYIATVGFTCSSGQGVADPAAGGLTLTGSLTTGQCTTGGCSSLAVETSQVASLLGMVGMQGSGVCGAAAGRKPASRSRVLRSLLATCAGGGESQSVIMLHTVSAPCRPDWHTAGRDLRSWQRAAVG